LTFDHEIRFFEQRLGATRFCKRHYSAAVKLFDPSLTRVELYYADVIQPKTPEERGLDSGIIDLQHVYPMGRSLLEVNDRGIVRVFAGASDAHTTVYDFDLLKLLTEMADDSPRRKSGQVYCP
jgi:hypothetical protein